MIQHYKEAHLTKTIPKVVKIQKAKEKKGIYLDICIDIDKDEISRLTADKFKYKANHSTFTASTTSTSTTPTSTTPMIIEYDV